MYASAIRLRLECLDAAVVVGHVSAFTVLSDTPMAAAIAGCAMPLSRNSTIWMRWRCASGRRDKLGKSQQRWLRDNQERLQFPFKLVEVRRMELQAEAGT
jgi:hypothetical protein